MESSNFIPSTHLLIEEKPDLSEKSLQLKAEKPKPTFKCLVCDKSYSKKTSLFTHHKSHPEHCVHCGENRGSSVKSIYEHNLKHVNIRPFVCKICGDSFLRNQQFVEHEKSHDKPPEEPVAKESKYKCKTCQSCYNNWKLFYKHQQESEHFNEKFLCEICGSEFYSNFLLSQHIRRLHKRSDETFSCSFCSKVFATKSNLDSHIKKIHQNDSKKHVCETCCNTFSSAPNLKQHIKTVHEAEKEYECQACKKPFKAKNRLTRHEKEVHMGKNGNSEENRIFNCDHCQKKYKRSWHQTRHSQMKHENFNSSTAATTLAGATPAPHNNENMSGNSSRSNYDYQHLQQDSDLQIISGQQPYSNIADTVVQTCVNNWSPHIDQSHHSQHQQSQQEHLVNSIINENLNTKGYSTPIMPQQQINGGRDSDEYANYAVNEQYSNKFEQVQMLTSVAAPTPSDSINQSSYDSWSSQSVASWDYTNNHHNIQPQPTYYNSQIQQNEWYYDPNFHQHHHGVYDTCNDMYNNYKTEYCLNQPTAPILHSAETSIYNNNNSNNNNNVNSNNNGIHYYYHHENASSDQHLQNPQSNYPRSNYQQNFN
ncbi:CLUMA_CG020198, isoform A [Clunio marinus]|uniref:CLUMA_CG020198, isoform A n=1 Tax=Clunio marinus TaxID=568069 RepID=A0A1J1J5I7_9DIPT|nr:CLUMA_CG020198, isoform A [Clunio marinus]